MGVLKKIINSIIQNWKTKSFVFAFFGVFVFGTIFTGFLSRVFNLLANNLSIPREILFPFGSISLWGYISLIYIGFSIFYLYKKIDFLSAPYQKLMCLFLGFYICSLIVTFRLTGSFSIFSIAGGAIYDLLTGVTIKYYFSSLTEFNINVLKCASELSFK